MVKDVHYLCFDLIEGLSRKVLTRMADYMAFTLATLRNIVGLGTESASFSPATKIAIKCKVEVRHTIAGDLLS